MAYTKQTWATGDTITAEKLNHMEDGIGDALPLTPDTLIVTFTWSEDYFAYVSDTTFQDMVTAAEQVKSILAKVPGLGTIPLCAVYDSDVIINFEYGQILIDASDSTKLKLTNTGFLVWYNSEAQKTFGSIADGAYYVTKAN